MFQLICKILQNWNYVHISIKYTDKHGGISYIIKRKTNQTFLAGKCNFEILYIFHTFIYFLDFNSNIVLWKIAVFCTMYCVVYAVSAINMTWSKVCSLHVWCEYLNKSPLHDFSLLRQWFIVTQTKALPFLSSPQKHNTLSSTILKRR